MKSPFLVQIKEKEDMKAILFVLAGSCSYGILSTIVKISYSKGFGVENVIGSQMLIGAVLLWVLNLFCKRNRLTWKQKMKLIAVGCFTFSTSVLYYNALKTIPASIAIVLLFQFTWMGILLESIFAKKRPSARYVVSALFLLGGTVLAGALVEGKGLQLDPKGIALGLLAALSFALFIFSSGKVEVSVPPIQRSAYMSIGAVVLTFIVLQPTFVFNGDLGEGLWLWGSMLGLFGACLPPLLFALGMPKVDPGIGSILGAAELPTAVICSGIFLHESISPLQWTGLILIFVGIAYPQFKGITKTKIRQQM